MKINTSQTNFEPIEEGVWEADITRLYDHTEFNRFDNRDKEGLRLEFTITEGEMRERKAYRFVSASMSPKSILWAIWKAVKKAEPTAEELAAIDTTEDLIEQLGGQPVKIIVKNKTSGKGNVYYTVADFIKSARTKNEFDFVAGAPEPSAGDGSYNNTKPQPAVEGHIADKEGEDMAQVAEEIFGGDEEAVAPVAKATAKKVV